MTLSAFPADAHEVLASTRLAVQKVRDTQRGASIALFVFAAITFAAIPFNRYGPHRTRCEVTHGGGTACLVYSSLALWYWPIGILAGYVTIAVLYWHRSRLRGVGSRIQPYIVAGAILAIVAVGWAAWADHHPAVLADTLRVAHDQVTRILYRLTSPAAAVGIALVVLAWIERSRALLAVTVAYLVVAVGTAGIAWFGHASPWAFLPHLLIDGAVLFIGGVLLARVERVRRALPR